MREREVSVFFQKSSHLYSEGLLILGVGGGSGGEGMEVTEIGKDPPLHPFHQPLVHYHHHQLTISATNKKKKASDFNNKQSYNNK